VDYGEVDFFFPRTIESISGGDEGQKRRERW
jgi:hypothetical protein